MRRIDGLTDGEAKEEVERILAFLREELADRVAVLGVSGGLDSDVVARLAIRALGPEKLKLFIAIQEDMDPQHAANADGLAKELGVPLRHIDLRPFPQQLIRAMAAADPSERFREDGLLDPSRAKCSLRTVVLSTYQDRGCSVLGTSNRTELELGFFLPLGDGLAHVQPIIHLYKSEVRSLAHALGSSSAVLSQPASSGFWLGAEDLWDIAYWLFAGEPIREQRDFSQDDLDEVVRTHAELSVERIDTALHGLSCGLSDPELQAYTELSSVTCSRLRRLVAAAKVHKHQPFFRRISHRA